MFWPSVLVERFEDALWARILRGDSMTTGAVRGARLAPTKAIYLCNTQIRHCHFKLPAKTMTL
jgi:hypothetical protein